METETRVRLFVAFELPPEVQSRIAARTAPLRAELPAASWVPAERLHLTLVFLGEVEESRLDALGEALRPAFGAAPRLRLRLAGAGTFPPGRPARVAWIGVEASGEDTLVAIERVVRAALAPILDRALEERPYHAHVTVARPRRPWRRAEIDAFRSACAELAGEWEAERAVLMESRLGRSDAGAARYEVRHAYPLGGEVAA